MDNLSWNIDDLKRRRLKLFKLLLNKNIPNDNVYDNIANYNNLIETYYNKVFKKDEMSKEDLICCREGFVDDYCYINNDLLTITNDIYKKNYKVFEELFREDFGFSICDFSIDDIIEMTYAFFKSLGDKELYDQFERLIDPNKHLIHIRDFVDEDYEYGFTVIDDINMIPYSVINRDHTINDLFTLPHEIMHMIFMLKLPCIKENSEYFYLKETEGIFCDYAYLNFLEENAKKLKLGENADLLSIKENSLSILDNCLDSLYIGKIMTDSFTVDSDFDRDMVNTKLKEDGVDLDIDDIFDTYANEDPSYNMQTALSTLSTLDLFDYYKKDKEKGLYLLKKLRYNYYDKCFDAFDSTGISFHKDGYKNLTKELDKVKSLRIN